MAHFPKMWDNPATKASFGKPRSMNALLIYPEFPATFWSFKHALKWEGRLVGRSSGNNVDGTTNSTPRMSLDQLVEGYRSILRRIYAPQPYYQRIRTFLREYRRPRVAAPLNWRHAFALAWSTVHLGLVGRERVQYWRLLGWTLFYRPALLQLAVTLAIYGHHFRRCCDAMGVE